MNSRIRRGLVVAATVLSLVVGGLSIRIAAELTAAAAPPPAPPISMAELQSRLTDEQNRAAFLQQQLDDLTGATGELAAALDATGGQVTLDGESAAALRTRLKAAEAKLAKVNRLLKAAYGRLAALGQATPPANGGSSGGGTGGTGGTAATPKPTAKPTSAPAPVTGFTLSVKLSANGVSAHWTTCAKAGFSGYALVRSLDSEIHYPPEDRDSVVATVSSGSTTSAVDSSAPSGRLWYRLYCLTNSDNETRVAATTSTVNIVVP